ncbi:S8 family serine peptidase [Haliangium sp.]|uniref:S8 family serine peptidase n=1 Tax=Haliangium sp. TaxID=2663208 RepID=UPI003D10F41D
MKARNMIRLLAAGLLSGSLVAGCSTVEDDFAGDVATTQGRLIGLDSPDVIPGQYIVVFKDQVGVQGMNAAMNRISFKSAESRVMHQYSSIAGFSAKLSSGDLDSLLRNPDVAYVEADKMMHITDKSVSGQLEIDRHDDCPGDDDGSFQQHGCTGAGVLVYIVDTGIRATHNEFTGRVNTARGFTSINDGNGTTDCNGHGTHVSSTAAGTTFGLADQATLIPVRVLSCAGSGSNSGVIAGVDHVASDCGANENCVANMSLGGGASSALDQAVRNAVNSGVAFAVAAGNDNSDASGFSPAREPLAITVGAASDSGYPATTGSNSVTRASFSNFGSRVDIWASGLSILGAAIGSDSATQTISGTSMASPHVAGAIAQMLSCQPGLTPAQVEAQLDAKAIANAMSNEQGAQDLFLCSDFSSSSSAGACACGGEPPPPPPPGGSCEGRCGQFDSTAECQCDDACTQFGDCCDDKAELCDGPQPGPDTCFQACGVFDSGRDCQCDSACSFFGDCCADLNDFC